MNNLFTNVNIHEYYQRSSFTRLMYWYLKLSYSHKQKRVYVIALYCIFPSLLWYSAQTKLRAHFFISRATLTLGHSEYGYICELTNLHSQLQSQRRILFSHSYSHIRINTFVLSQSYSHSRILTVVFSQSYSHSCILTVIFLQIYINPQQFSYRRHIY